MKLGELSLLPWPHEAGWSSPSRSATYSSPWSAGRRRRLASTRECYPDCWCKKPGLSLFRWVDPSGHHPATAVEPSGRRYGGQLDPVPTGPLCTRRRRGTCSPRLLGLGTMSRSRGSGYALGEANGWATRGRRSAGWKGSAKSVTRLDPGVRACTCVPPPKAERLTTYPTQTGGQDHGYV